MEGNENSRYHFTPARHWDANFRSARSIKASFITSRKRGNFEMQNDIVKLFFRQLKRKNFGARKNIVNKAIKELK